VSKKHLNVKQSNELTEATYSLALQAKRLIWLCLRQRYIRGEDDNTNPVFEISVADYAATFNVSSHTASKDIREAVKLISKESVVFHGEAEYEEITRPWLAEAGAKRGWGLWSIEFNPKIMPYITGLSSKFTTYSLYDCGKLKSVKMIRLYECLCQYRATGVFKVKPEWLANRFMLPDSQKNNRAELKRGFLEPAVKNINLKTQMRISLTEDKDGSFIFNFIENKPQENR